MTEAGVLEAAPAPIRLRTAALLLNDQQGGELSMVASVVRRPWDPEGIEALVTVELDGDSLRRALPDGGEIEGFIYLVDPRMEVYDSVSAGWLLASPSEVGAPDAASPDTVAPSEAEDSPNDATPFEDNVAPVRFTASFVDPEPGSYVLRILFRAGESFGLRSLPLDVPARKGGLLTLLEPSPRDTMSLKGEWTDVVPAGRGAAGREPPGLAIFRLGGPAPMTWATTGKGDAPERATLELRGNDLIREIPIESFRQGSGTIQLPDDLEVGRYSARLVAEGVNPSMPIEVLLLDGSLPELRWTDLDRLADQEEPFSGVALEMPASESRRVVATRRALFQAFADLEDGTAEAMARLRALEASLDENLQGEAVPFLREQTAKVVGRMMRRSRDRPEVAMAIAWLLMESAEYQRSKGRYLHLRLCQDVMVEIFRALGEKEDSREMAVHGMTVLGGWLQRQRFLDLSEALLTEALELAPDHPRVLSALASIFERYDKIKDAVEVLDRLATVEPDNGHTRVRLAIAHRRRGNLDDALKELDRAISEAGSELSESWWVALAHQERVRLEASRNRLDAAQKALDSGLRSFPKDPVLRLAQPWLDHLRGRTDEARDGLLALSSAPGEENARNRFHAWPRERLDDLSREWRLQARAAAPELATLARVALEKME